MTKKKSQKKTIKSNSLFERYKIPLLLFIGSFLIRFIFMEPALTHHDSIVSAQILEKFVATGKLDIAVGGRYAFILVNLVAYYPLYLITGANADLLLRVSGVLFSSFAVVALYYLTKLFFRIQHNDEKIQRISLYSAIIYSLSPLFLAVGTTSKEHGMSMFLVFTSLALALYSEEKNQNWMRAVAGILFITSISVRESNLVILPVYFLVVIVKQIHKKKKLEVIATNTAFHLIPILISFYVIYRLYFDDILQGAVGGRKLGRVTFLWWLPNVMKLGVIDVYQSVTLGVILLALLGLYLMHRREDNWRALVLLLWFLGPFYYFANTDGYNGRYLTLVVVPLTILAAYSIEKTYAVNKKWGIGLLVAISLMLFVSVMPLLSHRAFNGSIDTIVATLETYTESGSVIIPGDWGPHINYYTDRTVRQIPITRSKRDIQKYIKEWKIMHDEGTNVYLMTSGLAYDAVLMENMHRDILSWNFYLQGKGVMHVEDYHQGSVKYSGADSRLFQLIPLPNEWYEEKENITLGKINMTKSVVIPEDIEPLLNP